MSELTPIKLRIPKQDLSSFTLFTPSAEGAREWTQDLPVANTRQVVQQLRQAVGDLNRVQLTPQLRFAILETLRPNIHVALSNLSRRFLNQPLVLPVEPRQMAELADNLYGLISTGYTLVALHAIQNRDAVTDMNPAQLVCNALQRATYYCGRKILQTYQLYQPVELNGWLNLHQLYALAERQQLARLPVADELSGSHSITTAYLQALVLACCKPNQLRQGDLAGIFRALEEWSEFIQLEDPESGKGLFLIDLNSDQAPLYSAMMADSVGPQTRFIDTSALINQLEELQADVRRARRRDINFDKDTSLPANILDHLISCLNSMSMRNFTRTATDTPLSVGIGLSSAHYHTAGGLTFDQVLHNTSYLPAATVRSISNPFLSPPPKRDPWERADSDDIHRGEAQAGPDADDDPHQVEVDANMAAILEEGELIRQSPAERFPIFPVIAINASPGGYCLEWATGLPPRVRTGDIMCAREQGEEQWVIAVVRWISQLAGARTLIGVELLSPKAMSYGARIVRDRADLSEPMRVLLLPEIKLVGQPHTLVTPRSGFRERQKVVLMRNGEEFLVQLLRQVATTATFSQFDFRYIKQLEQTSHGSSEEHEISDSGFDSLWTQL